jgi:hypothetical protein
MKRTLCKALQDSASNAFTRTLIAFHKRASASDERLTSVGLLFDEHMKVSGW